MINNDFCFTTIPFTSSVFRIFFLNIQCKMR